MGLIAGQVYYFSTMEENGHKYICIDCGPAISNDELSKAMQIVQASGLKVVQNDDWHLPLNVVLLNHGKEVSKMWEFEVELQDGTRTFLFGYNYKDALRRSHCNEEEIKRWLYQEYVD